MAQGFVQSFKAALTQVDVTPFEPLGVIRNTDNNVFKYVKFSGTTTFAAGDFLCYVLSDTTMQTVDAATSVVGAGLALAAVTSGTVQYGWIQVAGVGALTGANLASGAAGNGLKPGSAAKQLQVKGAAADSEVAILVATGTPNTIMLICPY